MGPAVGACPAGGSVAVVVVVGVAAYDARSQFWNMYLAFKSSK